MPITPAQKCASVDLAALTYSAETNTANREVEIRARLAEIPAKANGPWTMVWGPGEVEGIVAYIALCKDRTTYAMVLGGSAHQIKAHEFIYDWLLNREMFRQVPWRFPSGNAVKVSAGMHEALAYVCMLTDRTTQTGVLDYFRAVVAGNGSLHLLVTGHGLGGALSQLVAQWLRYQFVDLDEQPDINILPLTFGAPTIGNQQFAMLFERTFPTNYALVNTLDIVPMAWWNLDRIQRMYPRPSQSIAEFGVSIAGLLALYKDSLAAAYKPVIAPPPEMFSGWMPSQPNKFEHTMFENHAIATYKEHITLAM